MTDVADGTPEDTFEDDEPVGDNRQYSSLQEAFQNNRRSFANMKFLMPIGEKFNAAGYFGRGKYIKVTRNGRGPALEIHAGYTNGFTSEAEIVEIFGDVERWHSRRGTGLWGVTHPDHGVGWKDDRATGSEKLRGGRCPECGDELPLSGVCNFCG